MENEVTHISRNKHAGPVCESSELHKPTNAGESNSTLKNNQEFIKRRPSLPNVVRKDMLRSRATHHDSQGSSILAKLENISLKTRVLLQSKSSTRMTTDEVHTTAFKHLSFNRSTCNLTSSRCEINLDTPMSRFSNSLMAIKITDQTLRETDQELKKNEPKLLARLAAKTIDEAKLEQLRYVPSVERTANHVKSRVTLSQKREPMKVLPPETISTSSSSTETVEGEPMKAVPTETISASSSSTETLTVELLPIKSEPLESTGSENSSTETLIYQEEPLCEETVEVKQDENSHRLSLYGFSEDIRPAFTNATLNMHIVEKLAESYAPKTKGPSQTIPREPEIQGNENTDEARRTSRKTTRSQKLRREPSPLPGPSTRNDDFYEDVSNEPEFQASEEEEQSPPDSPNEFGEILIPYDFLNQYLHVFENSLERAAVHVKYGQITECTCDLNDSDDPCTKHIAIDKLQYFEEAMEVMHVYSGRDVNAEDYSSAEKLMQEVCPNFFQNYYSEVPHELTEDDFYARSAESRYQIVKSFIELIKEEDLLEEFLQTELNIGEKRCIYMSDGDEDFELAVAFLMQEYPALFVQLTLKYEFFQLVEDKCVVNENRETLIELSKLSREELIEFDKKFVPE